MTMSTNRQIYTIESNKLIFRDNADTLLAKVEECLASDVSVDFINIENISRAFAHQYLRSKQNCSKNIEEININSHVQKMFNLVGNTLRN